MYSSNTKKSRFILIAVLLCAISTICSGGELSNSDLLRQIADGYEKNLSQLRTWTGFTVREGYGKGDTYKNGTIKWSERLYFVADRDQKANLWRGIRTRRSDKTGEQIKRLNSGMNKGGYTYITDCPRSLSNIFSEGPKSYLSIKKDKFSPKGLFTPEFDPVWVLTSTLGIGGQLGNALRMMAKAFEDKLIPEDAYKITREGSKVTLTLYRVKGNNSSCGDSRCGPNRDCKTTPNAFTPIRIDTRFFNLYVFDLKQGCSLLESHDIDNNGESHWILDYEEHNGVFVPNKITARLVSIQQNSLDTRKCSITTKTINEKIPPSVFQYEQLGLLPGDDIVDHSSGGRRFQWKSPDGIKDISKAVWTSILQNDKVKGTSKNKDKQAPKIENIKDTTLPANN